MAWTYDFSGTPSATLITCKEVLEDLGYELDVYAPESNLLVTVSRPAKYYFQRFDYTLVINVTDRVYIYATAEKYVFKRGSQWAVLGKEMLAVEAQDKLPVKLQNRIIAPVHIGLKQSGLMEYHEG